MKVTSKLRSVKTMVVAALIGVTAFLANALAQESPAKTWLNAGFVRPGVDGKNDDPLGATVYFAVYELSDKADANDPYRTGLADFAKNFVAGGGSAASPKSLVPEKNAPKYLYLYEVVNDRGIDQSTKDGIRFAANTELKSRDVGSMILKLPVDASAVHSWGYIKNAGFALSAFDRGVSGVRPAAAAPVKSHIAVSANPSVLHVLNGQGYARMAKPIEFGAGSGFSVDLAGKGLKNSLFAEELASRKGATLAAWEQQAQAAAAGGDVPESVDLVRFTDGDKTKPTAVLRTSFARNPLKVGRNSVLVGFTSNVPPGQDLVRIQDADTAKKGAGIRTVAMDDIDFGAGGIVALPKDGGKDAAAAGIASLKPANIVANGVVTPGDIPSGAKLVDSGTYKTFGGTVYFAVFHRVSQVAGDTWGVGRSDFDALFSPGESYRATFSPRLDTDAEYLYLYQVVNDRGFHDLTLPQNKAKINKPFVAENGEERGPITREVASFSLFLRVDPRLITSWGYFDDAGFNVKVPTAAPIKPAADVGDGSSKLPMAVSSNLSILETLYPSKDKEYRSWSQPMPIDFERTSLSVGKETLNITKNLARPADGDRVAGLRFVANRTLDRVKADGGVRPDYAQLIYFDGQNPVNGATIDGITLGPAEVARAVFKVEWLTKTITEGQQSVIFGFTSDAEPVRAPVRLKDLNATLNTSSEAQERVFLSPTEIKALAINAITNPTGTSPAAGVGAGRAPAVGVAPGVGAGVASAVGSGTTPGVGAVVGAGAGQDAAVALAGLNTDASDAALAVANGLGQGVLPAGLGILARGSVGPGIAISPSVATPSAGGGVRAAGGGGAAAFGFPAVAQQTGQISGGIGGGLGGGVGAIGTARMPFFGGGGFGGGSGGGNGGSSGANNQGGSGSDSGSNSDGSAAVRNTINFNVSLTNQQSQNQQQNQSQKQKQNQSQNQNQKGGKGGHGNVIPAPPAVILGLLGIPGLYFAYRRRRNHQAPPPAEAPQDTPIG